MSTAVRTGAGSRHGNDVVHARIPLPMESHCTLTFCEGPTLPSSARVGPGAHPHADGQAWRHSASALLNASRNAWFNPIATSVPQQSIWWRQMTQLGVSVHALSNVGNVPASHAPARASIATASFPTEASPGAPPEPLTSWPMLASVAPPPAPGPAPALDVPAVPAPIDPPTPPDPPGEPPPAAFVVMAVVVELVIVELVAVAPPAPGEPPAPGPLDWNSGSVSEL